MSWPLLILALLIGGAASAVSRVGGGTIADTTLGFSVQEPQGFGIVQQINSSSLRFVGAAGFTRFGASPAALAIEVHPLSQDFPELAGLNRKQLEENRSTQAWQTGARFNNCIDVYQKSSGTAQTSIVSWGPGVGIVIVASLSTQTVRSAEELLRSLQLQPGACKW